METERKISAMQTVEFLENPRSVTDVAAQDLSIPVLSEESYLAEVFPTRLVRIMSI